jgi:dTDP-4-amino-4,6-dideoxygalactose transaminase
MLNGRKREKHEIPFARPLIDKDGIKEVEEVLRSGWLAHGPKTKEFEQRFAEYCGAKYAVAVNSCTAALHLSLKALGVRGGDEIIVPAQTHVATAHAVMYQGATPIFADVDLHTYNIQPESIAEKINRRTRGVMVVHFAGQPCEMDTIYDIANEHHLFVVEDAAHALGAEYKGSKIGSLNSAAACFSFYPVKHITTGEGGMLVTNDEKIAEIATLNRAFGITKSTWERTTTYRPWYYEVEDIGFNYRMTEMGAAIGINQLKKIDELNKIRAKNAQFYADKLKTMKGIQLPRTMKNVKHANLFYQVLVTEASRLSRDELLIELKNKGIGTSVHYPVPVHLMPVYRNLFGYKEGYLPNAEEISKQAISLPIHPILHTEDLEYIASSLQELLC